LNAGAIRAVHVHRRAATLFRAKGFGLHRHFVRPGLLDDLRRALRLAQQATLGRDRLWQILLDLRDAVGRAPAAPPAAPTTTISLTPTARARASTSSTSGKSSPAMCAWPSITSNRQYHRHCAARSPPL
jgi:hypothetical protein